MCVERGDLNRRAALRCVALRRGLAHRGSIARRRLPLQPCRVVHRPPPAQPHMDVLLLLPAAGRWSTRTSSAATRSGSPLARCVCVCVWGGGAAAGTPAALTHRTCLLWSQAAARLRGRGLTAKGHLAARFGLRSAARYHACFPASLARLHMPFPASVSKHQHSLVQPCAWRCTLGQLLGGPSPPSPPPAACRRTTST